MTVGEMVTRNAGKFPTKRALVSEKASLDFKALNDRVNRLANWLLGQGLKKGDRIGVLIHNCHQLVEIYFAAAKTGGIFCPYNNHLKEGEMKDILDYSTPRFLFVDKDFGAMVRGLKPHLGSFERHICLQRDDGSRYDHEALLAESDTGKPSVEVVDEDGYVYIVERKGDMIISGGVNIYPREIEEVLYRHPAVSEASVIGVPGEHWGKIVKGVIVPKEGARATEDEIREFCGKNLAGFKKPKPVDFWTELPKSPQGKILKKDIRKTLRERMKSRVICQPATVPLLFGGATV